MMAPESGIDTIDLTEVVGDIEIPCEYDHIFKCGPSAARWEMRLACGCGLAAVRLACTSCKDTWLAADGAAECPACGTITAPARHVFWHIASLD